MRTKSAQATAVIRNPHHSATASVTVYSSSGGSSYTLADPFVLACEISEDVDSPRTARLRLLRQLGRRTLSPAFAHASLDPFSGEPVLAPGRRVKVTVNVTPDALPNFTAISLEVFDGYIDQVSWPTDEVEVECTDRRARLRDTWIERDRVYCFCQGANATRGAFVWRGDLPALAVNDLVVPSEANRNGHYYKVTAAVSAQGTVEPTWPTGGGATVISGGVTFTEAGSTSATTGTAVETLIQQILDDNGLASVATLQTPVSPSWQVLPFIQERTAVWDAVERLAAQIGWSLRFRWSSGLSRFELHLEEPNRSAATPDRIFNADEEIEVSEARVGVFDVRNVVQVVYSDTSARTPNGAVPRKVLTVSDATSLTKYGRRFCELQEASASNINTSGEASRLANAVLSDLKEPLTEAALTCAVDPFVEIGDLLQLPGDPLRWGTMNLAVVGLTLSVSGEGASSSFRLRGQPAARSSGWLKLEGRAFRGDVHKLSLANASDFTLTARDVVGGTELAIGQTLVKDALARSFEVHVGESAGFTPDSTTLKASGELTQVTIPSLVPGRDYFAKVIPFSPNGARIVRGEPSAALAFAAGRAKAGHYDSRCTQSHLPLNGNFEHASGALASIPFDHWQVVTRPSESTEEWGSAGSVYYGTDSTTKGNYIELRAHASKRGNLVSSPFEVRRGLRAFNIYLSIMRTGSSASSGKDLIVDVFGFSDAGLTNQVINYSVTLSGSASGPYPSLSTWYDTVIDFGAGYGPIPSNVNFLQIGLRRGTAGDSSFAWRVGDVYTQEADFYRAIIDQPLWLAPTFGSGWENYGTWQGAGYMLDSLGFVHLRGLVKRSSGAGTTILSSLPSNCRPAAQKIFVVVGDAGAGRVDVTTAGDVVYTSGGTGFLSLEGITYDTRS